MNRASIPLTLTDLIAAASEVLKGAGYEQVSRRFQAWDTPASRLFEDGYNIVGLVAFETCGALLREWPDRQGSLVEVISKHVGRQESKSWDGYLVLLTPGAAPSEGSEIETVRYNTTRLRKLVATGEELVGAIDVERLLRPLLPLGPAQAITSGASALDLASC